MKILINYRAGHAGPKIMRGFAQGFRALGHEVYDMTQGYQHMRYDLIMGYAGEGIQNFTGCDYTLAELLAAQLVQYWADDFRVEEIQRSGLILQSDRGCSANWSRDGLANTYVPLATDTNLFCPFDCTPEFDVVMTGFPSEARLNILQSLQGLNVAVFGPWEGGWAQIPQAHHLYRGCVNTEAELNAVYNHAKVCIDQSSAQNLDSANFTVFNAMASGCLLITNYKPSLDELFEEDIPPTYENDCRSVVEDALAREDLKMVALAQRETIFKGHTYVHRAKEVLSLLGEEHRLDVPPEIRAGLEQIL